MLDALLNHWPEYLIEGALLAIFMMSACVAVVILEHPSSAGAARVACPYRRRVLVGVLMGVTAVVLIYSPWGARSGAHMNPATTLTFLVLHKIKPWDAAWYTVAQFAGGLAGVAVSAAALPRFVKHPSVNCVATLPGRRGVVAAWAGEFAVSFGMMASVLFSANQAETAPYTGMLAGALLAVFIAIEAPLSGMSLNPARTLGSAVQARAYRGLWIYFTAPPVAMVCAAMVYLAVAGGDRAFCAKLNHSGRWRCIFNCQIDQMSGRAAIREHAGGIEVGGCLGHERRSQ